MIVSDENYVLLMKQGNEAALEYFIDKDGWIIKSLICRSSSVLEDERQECMNEVFWVIWQNVRKFDENRAAFTTWIAGVTRYCILNYLKKQNRMEYLTLDEIWDRPDERVQEIPLHIREEKEEFRALLKELSLYDQEIFMKLFWEEKSYEEICDEMQMDRSVLYNRISRGKRKLRRFLRRECF